MKDRGTLALQRASLVAVLTLLAACSTSAPHILNDSSCALPCWNGIQVGETSEQDLLDILAQGGLVDADTVTVANQPWQFFEDSVFFEITSTTPLWHAPWDGGSRISGEARILGDRVVDIAFCGEMGVTVGDVEAQVGAPTGVVSLRNPFVGGIDISTFNEKVGVRLQFNTSHVPKRLQSQLTPETPIECVAVFDPRIFPALLDAGFLTRGSYDADQTMEITYLWAGYGEIQELYPPRGPSSE